MTTWAPRPRAWAPPLPGECYMRHEDCARSLELRMACDHRYVDAVRRMVAGQRVRFYAASGVGNGVIASIGDGCGFYVLGHWDDDDGSYTWSGWVYPLTSGRLEPL